MNIISKLSFWNLYWSHPLDSADSAGMFCTLRH